MNKESGVKHRILIIDDNRAIHDDFGKILGGTSEASELADAKAAFFDDISESNVHNAYEIDSAFQGQEGVEMVVQAMGDQRPYDMAFVDMRMPPGWDGVETIENLWRVDPDLQVVICTAYSDYTWSDIIERLGVSDKLLILKKPFDNVEVSQLASAMTAKRRIERENHAHHRDLEQKVIAKTQSLNESLAWLSDAQQFLQSALDALTAQVAIVDDHGFIVAENAAWKDATNASTLVGDACTVGSNYLDHCHSITGTPANDAVSLARGIRDVIERRRDRFFLEYAVGDDATSSVWFTVRVTRFHGDGPVRAVVSHEDITDYKLLQSQLSQAQKLESIGQLAAGIAHEINTPMQYIGDNIDYLHDLFENVFHIISVYETNLSGTAAKRPWEDRQAEIDELYASYNFPKLRESVTGSVTDCREGFQRVTAITRAMKEFSHPGKSEKDGADVNELIRSTATISRNRWKYVADLNLQLASDLPTVFCRVAELNQVFLNMVVNAADAITEKYGNKPQCKGEITITTEDGGEHVIISVRDTGCGIPKRIRNRIFDPFFTTKDVGKGTGQGLAICYNVVVKMHGGEFDVDSSPGEGTTFTVRLPKTAPITEADESHLDADASFGLVAVGASGRGECDDDLIG